MAPQLRFSSRIDKSVTLEIQTENNDTETAVNESAMTSGVDLQPPELILKPISFVRKGCHFVFSYSYIWTIGSFCLAFFT